jgi:hypothetical protein
VVVVVEMRVYVCTRARACASTQHAVNPTDFSMNWDNTFDGAY